VQPKTVAMTNAVAFNSYAPVYHCTHSETSYVWCGSPSPPPSTTERLLKLRRDAQEGQLSRFSSTDPRRSSLAVSSRRDVLRLPYVAHVAPRHAARGRYPSAGGEPSSGSAPECDDRRHVRRSANRRKVHVRAARKLEYAAGLCDVLVPPRCQPNLQPDVA
jgi:hypothetical protein